MQEPGLRRKAAASLGCTGSSSAGGGALTGIAATVPVADGGALTDVAVTGGHVADGVMM